MIILNITFHTDNNTHDDALHYLKNVFIPEATKSGMLSEPRLRKIFGHDETDGHSYAVQFSVVDVETLEEWNAQTGRQLYAKLTERFSDKIAGFSTLLKEIKL